MGMLSILPWTFCVFEGWIGTAQGATAVRHGTPRRTASSTGTTIGYPTNLTVTT